MLRFLQAHHWLLSDPRFEDVGEAGAAAPHAQPRANGEEGRRREARDRAQGRMSAGSPLSRPPHRRAVICRVFGRLLPGGARRFPLRVAAFASMPRTVSTSVSSRWARPSAASSGTAPRPSSRPRLRTGTSSPRAATGAPGPASPGAEPASVSTFRLQSAGPGPPAGFRRRSRRGRCPRVTWLWRKGDRLRPLDEAAAYARCHGDRDEIGPRREAAASPRAATTRCSPPVRTSAAASRAGSTPATTSPNLSRPGRPRDGTRPVRYTPSPHGPFV